MKARRSVLLVITLMIITTACGDGGPSFLTHSDNLVEFKRVTLATDAPDRLEIENPGGGISTSSFVYVAQADPQLSVADPGTQR